MSDDARAAWLGSLDPGIAPYVDVLDAAGVETFESCEGGDGHAFRNPRRCGLIKTRICVIDSDANHDHGWSCAAMRV
jgi:hypothetical protein